MLQKGWACVINIEGQYHHENISSKQMDLAYDSAMDKKISFSALYIPSLMRDFFPNTLTPI